MSYLLAITIGAVCGLRPVLALAIVVWQLHARHVDLSGTGLQPLSLPFARWLLVIGAMCELVFDRRTRSRSRRQPLRFGLRLVCGAIAGAAVAASEGGMAAGALLGLAGAVVGCLGGIATRKELRSMLRNDRMAGVMENVFILVVAFIATGAPL